MEKISVETLLTTLFEYGFEKVDPVLFSLVLNKTILDDTKKHEFDFAFEVNLSKAIIKEDGMYRLSDNTNKDLWFNYHTNEKLLEYFKTLDFEKLITKKLEGYGYSQLDYILGKEKIEEKYFSLKELEIIDLMIAKNKRALFGVTDEVLKRREEMKDIISNNEYIEWLLEFTSKHSNFFYDDDWDPKSERISDKDRKNIKRLSVFFELVSEYAEQYQNRDGYFCKVKYGEEVLNVGVMHGNTVIHYASIASKTDEHGQPKFGYDIGATEYSEIVEKYKKYNKPKEYKKD